MNYFHPSEFECKCGCGLGLKDMKSDLLMMLHVMRRMADIPFIINSAVRCKNYNASNGWSKTSSHLGGYAIDIRCKTSRNRLILVNSALKVGFKRIGIGKDFIHVDTDYTKDQGVIWNYY